MPPKTSGEMSDGAADAADGAADAADGAAEEDAPRADDELPRMPFKMSESVAVMCSAFGFLASASLYCVPSAKENLRKSGTRSCMKTSSIVSVVPAEATPTFFAMTSKFCLPPRRRRDKRKVEAAGC